MGSLEQKNHALVYGASGITGWAIVNALLNGYPTDSTFSKVTALTNRPLTPDVAQWPQSNRLQVVSGLDLLAGDQASLEASMRERISDVESVTHVYFFAYIMDGDPEKEIEINIALLLRAVTAVEHLSQSLKFVVLPTGTKVSNSEAFSLSIVQVLTTPRPTVSISLISSPGRTSYHWQNLCRGSLSRTRRRCSTTTNLTC